MFKRRAVKTARQVRLVVLDAMKSCADFLRVGIESLRQSYRNALKFHQHFGALARKRRHAQSIENLRCQPRVRVAGHSHVVDFREC